MATIQRPVKEGSARTYQEKVGLGFVDILASEMDADLDTIYAAWNGGADAINIKDGAVTSAKLAPGAVEGSAPPGSLATSRIKANSIYGLNELAAGSVTRTELAAAATISDALEVASPSQVNVPATLTSLIDLTLTLRGGRLAIIEAVVPCFWNVVTTAGASFSFFLRYDTNVLRSRLLTPAASAGMVGSFIPFTVVLRRLWRPSIVGAIHFDVIAANNTTASATLISVSEATLSVHELS